MSRLSDLQLGTGALKPFSFKRTKLDGSECDVHVLIRCLTKRESDGARLQAKRTVLDLDKSARSGVADDELLAEARIVETLAIALRNPEKPEEQWATGLEITQTLDVGTIALLGQEYTRHQEACGPFIQDLTDEQADAMIEVIAKEGSADPFFLCASPLQNALVVSLARRHETLRMENFSSSSDSTKPSSESAPSESPSDEAKAWREAQGDVMAELAVQRDSVASLTIRVMHLEAERHRASAEQ